MYKALASISIVLLFSFFSVSISPSFPLDNSDSVNIILDRSETFFISLRDRDFNASWELLSKKSQKKIIDDVYRSSKKLGLTIKREEVESDFLKRGDMFLNYWTAFRGSFNPDMILEESSWEIGYIKKNEAEILIRHRKSSRPARLKLFRESDVWKVGLVETFWTRKY